MPDTSVLPKPEKRKPLTRIQFATLILKQEGRCGCGCGKKLIADQIIDEHVVALDFLGSNDLSNRSLWDRDCSKAKTARDLSAAAKGKRIRKAVERPPCIADGCDRISTKGGLCQRHYLRQWRYGDALAGGNYQTAPGVKKEFLLATLATDTKRCIEWPYPYNTGTGYGDISWEGRGTYAHRVMCILAHGDPPASQPLAAHSCGNRRCMNPQHLRWASHAENEADKKLHGTAYGNGTPKKLTALDVEEIRAARGKRPQSVIAKEYGIHQVTVSEIQTGKIWSGKPAPIPSRGFGRLPEARDPNKWQGAGKLQSRGFDRTRSKGFDGKVRERT